MRTILTNEDVKNIIEHLFNGNLTAHNISGGKIPYVNESSEDITLINEESGEKKNYDLAKYLNITFYSWKEKLEDNGGNPFTDIEEWYKSINDSLEESYALVECIDEQVMPSQDIDNAVKMGKCTIIMPINKISNLDYYVQKIRNNNMGVLSTIENSFGNKVKAYIMVGILDYEQEPIHSPLGEVIVCSFNFSINYLQDSVGYGDTKIELSLDNQNFEQLPFNKMNWSFITESTPNPTNVRPDLTGFQVNTISGSTTLSFYELKDSKFIADLNELFWTRMAISKDGVLTEKTNVNVPIYIKVETEQHSYLYKYVVDNIQKVITNGEFNLMTLSLKTYGKIEVEE